MVHVKVRYIYMTMTLNEGARRARLDDCRTRVARRIYPPRLVFVYPTAINAAMSEST